MALPLFLLIMLFAGVCLNPAEERVLPKIVGATVEVPLQVVSDLQGHSLAVAYSFRINVTDSASEAMRVSQVKCLVVDADARAEIASPMLDCVLDHGDAVVIDNGSHSFKVGYCGEDLPRSVVPALKVTIQRRRDSEDDGPAEDRPQVTTEVLLGKDAWKAHDPGLSCLEGDHNVRIAPRAKVVPIRSHPHPDVCELRPRLASAFLERIVTTPIKHGMIVDREALEELWEPILENHAQTDANNLTMLATYPPLTSPVTLEWMVEVLFEKFRCQRLALMPPGPLSLFSTGRSRGLVVEIGESITSATPVFEGFPLAYSTFRMFRAGGAVSTALSQILRQTPSLHGSLYFSNAEVKEEMKHKLCSVAVPDLHTQLRSTDTSTFEDRAFQLPDGSVIEVNQRLRYEPAEVLFDSTIPVEDFLSVPDVPRLLQSELRSRETLQGLVYAAISATDTEFQSDMKQNVVLAGGSSLLRGLSDRLLGELLCLEPADSNPYNIIADSQRRYSAWVGGSMFASLSTFPLFCVSRAEYEDGNGEYAALIYSKSFAR